MPKDYASTIDDQLRAAHMVGHNYLRGLNGTRMSLRDVIIAADSYFIDADFCALVSAAAAALPVEVEFEDGDFISPLMWVSVGAPLDWSAPEREWLQVTEIHDRQYEVLSEYLVGGFFVAGAMTVNGIGIIIAPFCDTTDELVAPFQGKGAIRSSDVHARWIKALLLLLSQVTITERSDTAPPRAFRKRAERGGVAPLIRVITLPKHIRERAGTGGPASVEWHTRWIVSGHWREQAHGLARSKRKRIWIAPYVKGPEDKPLRPQARRLFVAKGGHSA